MAVKTKKEINIQRVEGTLPIENKVELISEKKEDTKPQYEYILAHPEGNEKNFIFYLDQKELEVKNGAIKTNDSDVCQKLIEQGFYFVVRKEL